MVVLDHRKTKAQLISELSEARQRIIDLEAGNTGNGHGNNSPPGVGGTFLAPESLHGILDMLPHTVSIKDAERKYLLVNQSWSRFYGLTEEEVVERQLKELSIRSEWDERNAEMADRIILSGKKEVVAFEESRTNHAGEIRTLNLIRTPLRDMEGAIAGVIALGLDITEVRDTERKLEDNQGMLQIVTDHLPVTIVYVDADQTYRYINHNAEKWYGQPRSRVVGHTVSDVLGEETHSLLQPHIASVLQGNPVSTEERFSIQGGEPRYRELRYVPDVSEDGKVKGFFGLSLDVTERKKVEAESALNKALLETVFETIPVPLCIKDTEGRYLLVNKAMSEMYGLTPADFAGAHTLEITDRPPEDKQNALNDDQSLIRGEVERIDHTRLASMPDGRQRHMHSVKVPLKDSEGRAIGILGFDQDITGIMVSQQELRESERRFRDIVENSLQGVIIHSGKPRFANQKAAHIFGFDTPEGLLALDHINLLYHPDERERVTAIREARLRGETVPDRHEFTGIRPDGSLIQVETTARIIQWRGENVILSSYVDRTDQYAAEKEKERTEQNFRSLIESSRQGVVILAGEKPIFANQSYADIFGYGDPKEIMALNTVVELIAPVDRKRLTEYASRRRIGESTPGHYECQGIRKDGEVNWLDVVVTPTIWDGKDVFLFTVVDITLRKKAEEESRANQRLLQTVFNTVPHWLFVKDAQGRYLHVNNAMAEFFQLKPEDFQGKDYQELSFAPEEEVGVAVGADASVLKENRDVDIHDIKVKRPDGSLSIRHVVKMPLRDESGAAVGVVGLSEDITERQHMLAKLSKSEQQFRSLIEGSIEGVLIFKDKKPVFANQALADIFGYDSSEDILALKTIQELQATHEHARLAERGKHRLQGENVENHYEFQGIRENGETIWLDSLATLIQWDDEPAILATMFDITSRKEADEELRNSQRLLQTMFDTIPHWVYIKDKESRFLKANKALADSYGVRPEEFVGVSTASINEHSKIRIGSGEETTRLVELDRQVIESGKPVHVPEFTFTRGDGSIGYYNMYKLPFVNDEGSVIGVVGLSEDITERKVIEEKLLRNTERLRLINDAVPAIITYVDRDLIYRFINRQSIDWFGKPPEEVVGRHVKDVIGADAYRKLAPNIEIALRGEKVSFDELVPYEHKGPRNVHIQYVPHIGQGGDVLGFYAVSMDISDVIEAREELESSQQLFRDVLDSLPLWISVKNQELNYIWANKTGLGGLGVSLEEFLNSPSSGNLPMLSEENKSLIEKKDRELLSGSGMVDVFEMPFTFPDGKQFQFQHFKIPFRDAAGNVSGIVTASLDITDRKNAEQELEKMAAAADHAGDAIFITDRKGIIQYVNPSFEKITGYSKEEVIGETPRILKSGRHDVRFYQDLWGTMLRGEAWKKRYVNKKKDGSFYETEATQSPIHNSRGEITHFVSVQRDISHQVELEDQLRRSQRMEALGTLTGGIAHDFNNILVPVMGYADMLEGMLEPGTREHKYIQLINKSSERASELVSQILQFNLQREGIWETIRLELIVEDVVHLLESTLTKSIRPKMRINPDLPAIRANYTQIHQVIMNLCVNAGHAMPGGGTLSVSLKAVNLQNSVSFFGQTLRGRYLKLSIGDTGKGMDEETLAHIFEPFYTTKDPGKGTGLGLATVYGIVGQHDGGIMVESELGRGSTFDIYLPVSNGDIDQISDDIALPSPGKESILFVDDEEEIVHLGEASLESRGYKVTVALDGETALEMFQKSPESFDLVVTDQSMPGITGMEIASRMKEINPELPIVLCTGYSEMATPGNISGAGIDELISKPYRQIDLSTAIRRLLDR